jgi:PBSX family phage terminase large subunit
MNTSEWEDGKPELSPWQGEYIFKRFDDDLAIACCGVGSGKSAGLAIWLVMQCCKKPGIRGIMVAQTHDALQKALLREIRAFCEWAHIDYMIQNRKEIHFSNGSHLFGYSAENPTAVLGLSEIALLAIDEAAYIPEEMYNYCRDRMRGSKYKSMTRLISSPNSLAKVNNWFGNLVKKYPSKVIYASSLDNRFSSDEYKNELKERYQEGTNLYRQQVLGEIVDSDVASQIIFRHEFPAEKRDNGKEHWFGMDASGVGADSDMYAVIDKFGMVDYIEKVEASTQQKAGIVSMLYDKYKVKYGNIDMTGGYGQGVYDLSKDKNLAISGINFAQKAIDFEKYPNARTEIYLELAKAIKEGFWVNDIVKEEMLAQALFINNRGQGQLVPKDDVKKLLGHSPDLCDAVALAVYAMNHGEQMPEYSAKKASDIANKYLAYFSRYN